MKKDLFIKILERGSEKGLGAKFDISDILTNEFSKPISTDMANWNPEVEVQFEVLRGMWTMRIIIFDSMETNKIHWDMTQNKPIWFDQATFNVSVTVEGLTYLNQYYLRQSTFGLNEVLKVNANKQTETSEKQAKIFSKQTKIFWYSLGVTIANLIIAAIILKATLQSNSDKQEIVILHQQLNSQAIELNKLKAEKSDTIRYVLHYPRKK